MTLTGQPGFGNELLVVADVAGSLVGGDFDLWFCPDQTVFPDDEAAEGANGDCVGPFIQTRTGDSTTFRLIEGDEGDGDESEGDDGQDSSDVTISDDVCGLFFIVHDYPGGGHSNWVGPWLCGDAPAVAVPTLALVCTPDPVMPGGTVTCEVTGGDPGIAILWAAAVDGVFASTGVTLDAQGRGTFTFVAPRTAAGQHVSVTLVDWSTATRVAVGTQVVPASIPAGEGSGVPSAPSLLLASALLLGVVARLRSAATAPTA
jgi:hypothetical protein